MTLQFKHKLKLFLPALASLLGVAIDFLVPTHPNINTASVPYFGYIMVAVTIMFLAYAIRVFLNTNYHGSFAYKVKFYTALVLFLGLVDLLTDKMSILPQIYFPSINNIIGAGIAERTILLKSTGYSIRLLLLGIIFGGIFGILTGVLVGWVKNVNYWVSPIIRFIGPIPTAIWIPMALLAFPTLLSASVFIVALTMWFPTWVQTSSGIQNVKKGYYDVANTLGANTFYQIVHIAIPAAAPQIFVGIFSGVVTSFISLILAELMGSKYGLGWYINWKQQIMDYPNVWAALLILAILCYLVISFLFYFRKKYLSWQEGMIRW